MATDISVHDVGTYIADDKSWLIGEWQNGDQENVPLDFTKFTGTNFADGYIKSGCVVGMVTATKKFGPYDAGATDGRQTPLYHLINTTKIPANTATVATDAGVWDVMVRQVRLPYPSGPGSIDAAGKTAMSNVRYV